MAIPFTLMPGSSMAGCRRATSAQPRQRLLPAFAGQQWIMWVRAEYQGGAGVSALGKQIVARLSPGLGQESW